MLTSIAFPVIDPILISIGPLDVHWYGIAYAVGVIVGYYYCRWLTKKHQLPLTKEMLDEMITYMVLGIIIGGRLGFVLVYDPVRYLHNPIDILKTYEGGMSFHGGLMGVIIAATLYCKKYKYPLLKFMDMLAVVTPIGLFLGRIANFINGELYGRLTNVSWGVIFPGQNLPRHPSQLYEAAMEGLLLIIIMYFASSRLRYTGFNSSLFMLVYGLSRILCEFFREPDIQIGYIYGVTMGQILSLPMVVLGIYGLYRIKHKKSLS